MCLFDAIKMGEKHEHVEALVGLGVQSEYKKGVNEAFSFLLCQRNILW